MSIMRAPLSKLLRMPRWVRYLQDHWRAFVFAASVGIAVPCIGSSWTPHAAWVHAALSSQDVRLLSGLGVIILAILLVSRSCAETFWQRYSNTWALERPPLQYIDVIVVAVVCAFLTCLALFHAHLMALWRLGLSTAMRLFLGGFVLIGVAWLLSVRFLPHRKAAVKDTPLLQGAGSGGLHDDPITEDSQDFLGRGAFVEDLYQQIVTLAGPNSFVFGLYGSWGVGKTSVLNLLERRLAAHPLVIPVRFNPWYLASEAGLIQSFYAAIEQALRHRYRVAGLHRVLSRYGEVLTSGLSSLGVKVKLAMRENPERLRHELEEWIGRTGCRLVILIDDIDRLAPSEVLAVLKVVGLSARIQQAVFILSFDVTVIQNMLRERVNIDAAFLDKIVQKPVFLPPAEQQDLDRFLLFSEPEGPGAHRSAIDRLLDDLGVDPQRRAEFDKEIAFFYQTQLHKLFHTLRDVKRYLNSPGSFSFRLEVA